MDPTAEPAAELAALLERDLERCFASITVFKGQVCGELPAENLRETCLSLRDHPSLAFEQLTDLCGVDYAEYGLADWETSEEATLTGFSRGVEPRRPRGQSREGPHFAVVYHLLSMRHNRRLRLRVFPPDDPPRVDSVVEIWASANWYEREAFDLFGILFVGHPDLRRILTDYGFVGHPMRKDFPLSGNVEMRYDPEKGRVIYEPVSIEPRILVPRVIRHERRDAEGHAGGDATDA